MWRGGEGRHEVLHKVQLKLRCNVLVLFSL